VKNQRNIGKYFKDFLLCTTQISKGCSKTFTNEQRGILVFL
jgi:hypothetical protein